MIIKAITASDEMWNKVKSYAYNCSWKAGKSLAKAYEINDKNIEMLDFEKDKKLLEDYYRWLDSRRK